MMKSDRHFFTTIQGSFPVQIFICYCFFISGFLVNFLQLISWILIWPINHRLYRRINYYLATLIWSRKLTDHSSNISLPMIFLFRINVSLFLVVEFWYHCLCWSKRSSITSTWICIESCKSSLWDWLAGWNGRGTETWYTRSKFFFSCCCSRMKNRFS